MSRESSCVGIWQVCVECANAVVDDVMRSIESDVISQMTAGWTELQLRSPRVHWAVHSPPGFLHTRVQYRTLPY